MVERSAHTGEVTGSNPVSPTLETVGAQGFSRLQDHSKTRVHLDIIGVSVAQLLAAGASVLTQPDDNTPWTVLFDPDGNEFCAFT